VRAGDPVEEPDDLALAVWAGRLPLDTVALAAIPDRGPDTGPDVPAPAYVQDYRASRTRAMAGAR